MSDGHVNIASYDSRRAEHDFLGKSLEDKTPGPGDIYWFGVFLAFFALPAIASVSLAEYSFSARAFPDSQSNSAWLPRHEDSFDHAVHLLFIN